jgi:hypothetical protein
MAAADEKIIHQINSKKLELAEASRKDAVVQSVSTGCAAIGGLNVKFVAKTILEGQITAYLPAEFESLSSEATSCQYPYETEPDLAFVSRDGLIHIIFNHTQHALQAEEIPQFRDELIKTIAIMQPEVDWQGNGVLQIEGKNIGFCDFVVPARDDYQYHFLFFLELNRRVLLGALNCPVTLLNDWGPIARGIMNSVRVNFVPETAPSPALVKDFSNYQFKSGLYAIYQDKEYRLFKLKDGNCRLISFDADDLANGFVKQDGVYKKTISNLDLTTVYQIKTQIVYQGQQFELGQVLKNQVQLVKKDCSSELAKQLQLEKVDYREYEKWVDKDQLEDVWEEKSDGSMA